MSDNFLELGVVAGVRLATDVGSAPPVAILTCTFNCFDFYITMVKKCVYLTGGCNDTMSKCNAQLIEIGKKNMYIYIYSSVL